MKKLIGFLVVCLLGINIALAQTSISLSGVHHSFVGSDSIFPYGQAKDYPALKGGQIKFNFGLNFKTSLSAGITTAFNFEKKFVHPRHANATTMVVASDININYYLLGAYNQRGGLYLFSGLSLGLTSIKWNFTSDEFPEPDRPFFENKKIMFGNMNFGVGAEAYLGRIYLFGEGKYAANLNHFVNNTTIWDTHIRNFMNINLGVRIPLGAKQKRRI